MAEQIIVMKTEGKGAPPMEAGQVSSDVLLAGLYETRTWNHYVGENDRLYCGIWECTPGKVAIDYKEWEFCHFIEGRAILSNEAGQTWTLEAGDGFIIPCGFKGTWETVEKVRKHYVILNSP